MESKKINKLLNITKQKQTHKYREQTGVASGERGRKGQYTGRGLRGRSYNVYSNLQGYIVQHEDYSEYFMITLNGV